MVIILISGKPLRGSNRNWSFLNRAVDFNSSDLVFHKKNPSKNRLKTSLFLFVLLNFLWLIFRSGTKPSRLTHPCQRVAASNISSSLTTFLPFSAIFSFFSSVKSVIFNNWIFLLIVLGLGTISGGLIVQSPSSSVVQNISLSIEPQHATISPTSDIYVINGYTEAYIGHLISLMSSQGLFFYKSDFTGSNQSPNGVFAQNDVIILKINAQWSHRGGTNTDLLKEVIQAITNHPAGFTGEIIVADNGQGWGSMDHSVSNAENRSQSTQTIVDEFSSGYKVSTYDWQQIRNVHVDEYEVGDINDGYIRNDTADPETGIFCTYPKFETVYGTKISFKLGVWNGTDYNKGRLKVINMPVLKSHFIYGVTGCLKNYMGVQSEGVNGGIGNGHNTVGTGGMGSLLVDCGLPTLNILDVIWINANPFPSSLTGPVTPDDASTRVNIVVAGVDPVSIDYWATRHVLMPTASLLSYDDLRSLDPDNFEETGLQTEAGIWFNLTKHEILRAGIEVTSQENQMNVFVDKNPIISSTTSLSTTISSTTTTSSASTPTMSFGLICLVASILGIITLKRRKQPKI
ncbi:MAG: DUF362 domain-containing protein [Candidatus Hodarchaeales archaeon]|jgi:hypothetical protein